MLANGYTAKFAEQVFLQISGFGEYGFPESHAASFALLVYVSAWLKCYYPAAFAAALLNSQPMGFYQPAQLVSDAQKHGVAVRPLDVNFSDWDCTLEAENKDPDCPDSAEALRLGLRLVRGLSQGHAAAVVQGRGDGPYTSFDDFVHRTRLSSPVLTHLADADAFPSLHLDRRSALWRSLDDQEPLPLFDGLPTNEPEVALSAMPALQEVLCDYRNVGLSLKGHPMQFLRPTLEQMRVVPASALAVLPNGGWLRVAGVVLMRQRPSTANGITFVTLEDETGQINLIIRPQVWDRYHAAARTAAILLAHGRLQREGLVIHVLVERLEDLTTRLANLPARSRDFR
jgi:error-prone DNA polymerase